MRRRLAITTRLRAARQLAWLALAALVIGFFVAPLVHLIGHRFDHHHGDDVTTTEAPRPRLFVHDAEVERERAAAERRHAEAHRHGAAHAHPSDPRPTREAPHAPHGAGALEHFGVALLAVATFFFLPLEAAPIEATCSTRPPEAPALERVDLAPIEPRAPPA